MYRTSYSMWPPVVKGLVHMYAYFTQLHTADISVYSAVITRVGREVESHTDAEPHGARYQPLTRNHCSKSLSIGDELFGITTGTRKLEIYT